MVGIFFGQVRFTATNIFCKSTLRNTSRLRGMEVIIKGFSGSSYSVAFMTFTTLYITIDRLHGSLNRLLYSISNNDDLVQQVTVVVMV